MAGEMDKTGQPCEECRSGLAKSPISGEHMRLSFDLPNNSSPAGLHTQQHPKRPESIFYSRSEHGSSVHLMLGGLEDNPSSVKLRELFSGLSVETGLQSDRLFHNTPVARLYEDALKFEEGSAITSSGALATFSGARTGRCPKDKRVVAENGSDADVWWGPVNIPLDEHTFMINRERAVDYLKTRKRIYVFDGYAGWDPQYRIKVRVICARAYHALFMNNMLIRPTEAELETYGKPDFTILNAGAFPANRYTSGMTSETSVTLNFHTREMVILGTEYAGEMKKGIFTVMHYLMPKQGVLSLHSSANCGAAADDVTLFFGLSGTGKTTLSADVARRLIGDDEHCWSDHGIFNIEGGCYAKCIHLTRGTPRGARAPNPAGRVGARDLRRHPLRQRPRELHVGRPPRARPNRLVAWTRSAARSTTTTARSRRTRAPPTPSSTSPTPRSRASPGTPRTLSC